MSESCSITILGNKENLPTILEKMWKKDAGIIFFDKTYEYSEYNLSDKRLSFHFEGYIPEIEIMLKMFHFFIKENPDNKIFVYSNVDDEYIKMGFANKDNKMFLILSGLENGYKDIQKMFSLESVGFTAEEKEIIFSDKNEENSKSGKGREMLLMESDSFKTWKKENMVSTNKKGNKDVSIEVGNAW